MAQLKDLLVVGPARFLSKIKGNLQGNADTATKLETSREISINLSSNTPATFDGSDDIIIGVDSTLPVARGGTGITSNPSLLVNLASTTADTVFEASPRPGVTGALPIANGGTGATTAANALKNLGLTATAAELNYVDGVTSSIQTQINNLKASFQDGCDTIVAGCTTYGDTPASNSPSDIVTSIKNIYNNRYNSGVTATKVGTATAAHVLSGKTFTNSSGVGIAGTMPNNGAVSQALAANGSYTIPAGYHNGSGKVTQSLTTKAATTYGASTSDQTIAANQYLTGVQTIKKVEQSGLSAANILKGKTITISSNGSNLWNITGTGTAINPSAMKMYIGSSTPSSPNEADIFYNMSNDNYYIYNNGSWVQLTKQILQLIVFNGTTFANGYSLQTVGKNSSTVGTFFAKSRYNSAGGHQEWAHAWLPINCTNWSKITVTYSTVMNSYATVQIGLCNVAGTSARFYADKVRDNSVWNIANNVTASGTVSFNLQNVTGVKYLAVATDNTQGNQTDAIITKVILE